MKAGAKGLFKVVEVAAGAVLRSRGRVELSQLQSSEVSSRGWDEGQAVVWLEKAAPKCQRQGLLCYTYRLCRATTQHKFNHHLVSANGF